MNYLNYYSVCVFTFVLALCSAPIVCFGQSLMTSESDESGFAVRLSPASNMPSLHRAPLRLLCMPRTKVRMKRSVMADSTFRANGVRFAGESLMQSNPDEAKALQRENRVVLSLVSQVAPTKESGTNFLPKLIVWQDGSMLFGRPTQEALDDLVQRLRPAVDAHVSRVARTNAELADRYAKAYQSIFHEFSPEKVGGAHFILLASDMEYFWGQTTPQEVEKYVENIRTSLQFDKSGMISDGLFPDNPHWRLRAEVDDRVYAVHTTEWRREIPGWIETRNGVCKWGEAVTQRSPETVRVRVDRFRMTVWDKDGHVLAQWDIPK